MRRALSRPRMRKIDLQHKVLRENNAQPVYATISEQFRIVGTRYLATQELPRGTQARLMQAGLFSQALGNPLDTTLTINAYHLLRIGEGGIFSVGHLWDGFQLLLELIRKWVLARGVPWASIWVREWSRRGHNWQSGEHWHIAMCLPKRFHDDFAKQVVEWTGEVIGHLSPMPGVSAVSAAQAWQIATKHGRGGPESIGAYFGKAERSKIKRYGKWVDNPDKPRRNKNGGNGHIEGKRFGICKTLGTTEQSKAGYHPIL
jgi:hypothetical protein